MKTGENEYRDASLRRAPTPVLAVKTPSESARQDLQIQTYYRHGFLEDILRTRYFRFGHEGLEIFAEKRYLRDDRSGFIQNRTATRSAIGCKSVASLRSQELQDRDISGTAGGPPRP